MLVQVSWGQTRLRCGRRASPTLLMRRSRRRWSATCMTLWRLMSSRGSRQADLFVQQSHNQALRACDVMPRASPSDGQELGWAEGTHLGTFLLSLTCPVKWSDCILRDTFGVCAGGERMGAGGGGCEKSAAGEQTSQAGQGGSRGAC